MNGGNITKKDFGFSDLWNEHINYKKVLNIINIKTSAYVFFN